MPAFVTRPAPFKILVMEKILASKLHSYLIENHPDLCLSLVQKGTMFTYVDNKVQSVISLYQQLRAGGLSEYKAELQCFSKLKEEIGPSRYHYICNVLKEQFYDKYLLLRESGELTNLVLKIVTSCQVYFTDFAFSTEPENNHLLYQAVCLHLSEYFGDAPKLFAQSKDLQQPSGDLSDNTHHSAGHE